MTKKESDRKIFAWLAAFLAIVGFLIALAVKKDDKYVMFYAKQGLVLGLGFILSGILSWIPIVGWIFSIFIFILWIITWINALSGKEKNTWLVGDLASKFKF